MLESIERHRAELTKERRRLTRQRRTLGRRIERVDSALSLLKKLERETMSSETAQVSEKPSPVG